MDGPSEPGYFNKPSPGPVRHDVTKLPKWAQEKIKDLREQMQYWREIAEGRREP